MCQKCEYKGHCKPVELRKDVCVKVIETVYVPKTSVKYHSYSEVKKCSPKKPVYKNSCGYRGRYKY